MLALIALGGDCTYTDALKSAIFDCGLIIAADRGYVHVKELGLIPEFLVGDMDSIPNSYLVEAKKNKNIKIKEYNPDKNMTDSEIATKIAIEKGYNNIIYIGSLGNRPDHVLGNQMHAAALAQKGIYCVLTDGVTFIYAINPGNSPFKFSTSGLLEKKDVVSIIPVIGNIENINISNLKYTLNEYEIPFGSQRGVSNTVNVSSDNDEAIISVGKGVALLILTKND